MMIRLNSTTQISIKAYSQVLNMLSTDSMHFVDQHWSKGHI